VLFGPRHASSRDARLLLSAGGGVSAATPPELRQRTLAWLRDPAARADAGARARALVRAGLGAARRSFGLVESLLGV
jgi:hypothetical protein